MAKRQQEDPRRAAGNTVVTRPPCRPEDYYSNANTWQPGVRSILQANAQARLAQRDQEHAYRHGAPFAWDQKQHEVRARYNEEFCLPGRANRGKCCDDLC